MNISFPQAGLVLVVLACGACTNEQLYNSTTEWRAQECSKLSGSERTECLANTRTPYSEYQKARDETAAATRK